MSLHRKTNKYSDLVRDMKISDFYYRQNFEDIASIKFTKEDLQVLKFVL